MKLVSAYTDGSHDRHSNTGGYGIILMHGQHMKKIGSICYKDSTNNRMELKAVIKTLQLVKPGNKIDIYSDSEYVVNTINVYLPAWCSRGIVDTKLNADLWFEFLKEKQRHAISQLRFIWIRGHAHSEPNKMADKLAREARQHSMKVVCKHNN